MSALRALRQLTTTSSRISAVRNFSTVSLRRNLPAVVSRQSCAVPLTSRTFSVSARCFGEGTSDVALAQRLQEEMNYEKDSPHMNPGGPEFLKAFKEQGVWEIEDKLGNDEVVLRRKFGNEDIRLIFSIADFQGGEEDFQQESESESESETENAQDEPFHLYPIRAALSITKTTTPGCINVDMVCQEGNFVVENVSFYHDTKLGTELSAEADWKRRGIYIGPQFETLDVAVQEEFEKFLQERGVNEDLALFIPEYAEHKEQVEYTQWLGNVKSFVEK